MSILRKRHCVLQFQTNQNVLYISNIYTRYTYRRFIGWNILKSNNIDHINQKRKPLGVVYFRKCFTNLNILHVMNLEALMSLVKLSQGNQLFRYCNLTPRCVKCFYQVSNPVIPCKVGNGNLNHRNNNTRHLYNICQNVEYSYLSLGIFSNSKWCNIAKLTCEPVCCNIVITTMFAKYQITFQTNIV